MKSQKNENSVIIQKVNLLILFIKVLKFYKIKKFYCKSKLSIF
jgi:hypothetical protein